jgi:hypothetical protein
MFRYEHCMATPARRVLARTGLRCHRNRTPAASRLISAGSQDSAALHYLHARRPSKPIPVITPVLEGLQAFAMPRTLPDGRVESPGVLRIYLASMFILAAFYAISAVIQVRTAHSLLAPRLKRFCGPCSSLPAACVKPPSRQKAKA